MKRSITFTIALIAALTSCSFTQEQSTPLPILSNDNATTETRHLYANLKTIQKSHILFGHHDCNSYGHTWNHERNRTDVNDVCGSHPAVYGHDFSSITTWGLTPEQLKENADYLRTLITEAYNRGGINTITWHFRNPAVEDGKFYYDKEIEPSIPRMLPGGELNDRYCTILGQIADFALSCKGNNGELIPMIFRPYHEYDGDWFWWGIPYYGSVDEFKQLWQFTHDYLSDTLKVNNFIWAISPDCKFDTEEEFLRCYPGDEYVDMVAMDNYWDLRPDGGTKDDFVKKIAIVSRVAHQKDKLAALSETGLEGIPEADWWTGTLLRLLQTEQVHLSYVMVWRNAHNIPTHFYAPFPGQPSAEDFIRFRNDPYTLFENDIKGIYSADFKIEQQ